MGCPFFARFAAPFRFSPPTRPDTGVNSTEGKYGANRAQREKLTAVSRPNLNTERGAAESRAALKRRSAEMGVTPFDAEEWLSVGEEDQALDEAAREVGEFLSIMRELRDTPSTRSAD